MNDNVSSFLSESSSSILGVWTGHSNGFSSWEEKKPCNSTYGGGAIHSVNNKLQHSIEE